MPKNTKKYSSAIVLVNQLQISQVNSQEETYKRINEQGYYWDSKSGQWQNLNQDADLPTELIKIRVWAESSQVASIAHQVRVSMQVLGHEFLEQSDVYPCRPPKQLESRIYLSFKRYLKL